MSFKLTFSKMLKPIYLIILIIVLVTVAFFGYKIYHRIQLRTNFGSGAGSNQSVHINNGEGEIPKSGDLCGGTGGNGQIVSVGKNRFTLKQKNSSNRIIHLTDQAKIKISTGSGSLSDLKIGDRVTLVGGPNSDGSFTADTVVLCN